jgi:hypothetical protein
MLLSVKLACQITSDQCQVDSGLGRLPQELPESGKLFPFTLIRVQGNPVPFLLPGASKPYKELGIWGLPGMESRVE